jgi:hypothetical protein
MLGQDCESILLENRSDNSFIFGTVKTTQGSYILLSLYNID